MVNLLEKIQSLSQSKRKMIFWVLLCIIGAVLMGNVLANFRRGLQNLDLRKDALPEIQRRELQDKIPNLRDQLQQFKDLFPKILERKIGF